MDTEYFVELIDSPFGGYLCRYRFTVKDAISQEPLRFFRECRATIRGILLDGLRDNHNVKYWLCIAATYRSSTDETKTIPAYFPILSSALLNENEIDPSLNSAISQIANEIESFEEKGSDWILTAVEYLDLYTIPYEPLAASSYVPLPKYITDKRAVLNIHNTDQKCFMWSVLAHLHPVSRQDHPDRVAKYVPYTQELNFEGTEFPVRIKDIPHFAQQNEISVNVYSYDNGFFPVHISKVRHRRHVNLLLYKQHYCLIRDFDRLLGDQNDHRARKHYCDMCLFPFYSKERLAAHADKCLNPTLSEIVMPESGENTLQFDKLHRMLRKPVVVYGDFECILHPTGIDEPATTDKSYTHRFQQHEPCSVGMIVSRSCCGKATYDPVDIFTNEDPAKTFIEKLVRLAESYRDDVNCKPLNMTRADQENFGKATICAACNKPLGSDKVRDHCHTCGRFRAALHSKCNQALRISNEVTVVIHNLRRYDSHLIMQSLGKACNSMNLKLDCIARAMEDYVTFSITSRRKDCKWKIRFIDSVQFLSAPLAKLVEALPADRFRAMKQNFTPEELELLLRKGVFPYDLLSSRDMLNYSGPFTKEQFWNKLLGEDISDADLNNFLLVWQMFGIEVLRQYMELYLKTDVLLLADVFEAFREFCVENFSLDPCHYATLPGMAWDAALKFTGVELELLTDPDMYSFFESGIRGGISVIVKRKAEANNPYMDSYDPAKPTNYIIYDDANNLYGCSMMEPLPQSDFKWVENPESINVEDFDATGETGYILEVDLEYPPEIHDAHNCYPLAPESFLIEEEMLSPYSAQILRDNEIKYKPARKLVPNLYDKTKYVVHIRNLQMYLRLGMKLKKIHRAISFRQSRWLAPYVQFNTNKRKQAKTELDKNLHKLLVNAVFGKTMKNVRKYVDLELVTTKLRMKKVCKKVHFLRASAFNDDLVGCVVRRKQVMLNKPIYAGFTILDVSKTIMYEFHYNYIRPKYGDKAELLMTDTDSLMYDIQTDDLYKDMEIDIDRFDTSDYPTDHFLHSTENKKVVGKMKDELSGEPVHEFVGLRAKMYSLKTGRVEKKRAKGVKRSVVSKLISHTDYRDTLNDKLFMYHKMNMIRSYNHQLYTVTLNKKSLGCFDDKRYILDGVRTLAHGHYRIDQL